MDKRNNNEVSIFKSVLIFYMIMSLHVLLIAALGLLVLFFQGMANYMGIIFIGGVLIITVSAFLFYKRMKAEGRSLRDMLRSPLFRGQSVEVSFLGGLASFKVSHPDTTPALEAPHPKGQHRLEDPETIRIRELTELARMLERNLITMEEYDKAKQQIFKSG
jgi:hypothetical protein